MNSERVLPLEILLSPRESTVQFARALAPAFADQERFAATAFEDVVVISTIWEPDLDVAAELVARTFPGEVRWGEPRVRYRYEPRILWPLLHLEVSTPPETVGNVLGDLMSRRGLILGQDDRGDRMVLTADVPLAELFGYLRSLNACTYGKGQATATFARYEPAPPWLDPNEPAAMALRA